MTAMSDASNKEASVETMPIIIRIPVNSAHLEIKAKIMDEDGQTTEGICSFTPNQIAAARRDFLDNVDWGDEYDAVYSLTEEGKKLARFLKPDY